MGVEKTDPNEYLAKHNSSLKDSVELPPFGIDLEQFGNTSAMSEEFKNAIKEIKAKEDDSSELLFTRNYLDTGSGYTLLLGGTTHLPVDFYELEGDLDALKLIDLNKQGYTIKTTTIKKNF